MSKEIHQTLPDNGGIYQVVSKTWTQAVATLLGALVLGFCFLGWQLRGTVEALQATQLQTEKWKQRSQAMDEMLLNRAIVQKWTYEQACDYAKSLGKVCLENPIWWADPAKYPLIANDPSGTGLFPKENK